MAGAMGAAWSFWQNIKEISPRAIEEAAEAGFKLALIGSPERRAWLKQALLTDKASAIEREDADAYLREFEETPEADAAAAYAFLIYPGDEGEPIGVRGENGTPLTGSLPEVIEGMLKARPKLTLALAKRFPAFRVAACNRLIREVSRVNAQIALISALPGVLPITGIILPASSIADTILLTKNQIMLVMRLAAAHGLKPAYSKQVKELLSIVGAALGWRTLARELVGLVPGGIGLVVKGAIAYSGTFAIGKSALYYYQTGKKPSKEAIRAAYEESQQEAREESARALDELKPK
jgi:uncharacterized protein (DUF697 family)